MATFKSLLGKANVVGKKLIDILNSMNFEKRTDAYTCLAITVSTLILSVYRGDGISKSEAKKRFELFADMFVSMMKATAEDIYDMFPNDSDNNKVTPLGSC